MSTLKTIKLQNPSGASSNIDLGVGGEVLIGSASTTGTASQRLQVTGGAYVSGNVGLGATNPSSKLTLVDNTTSSFIIKNNNPDSTGLIFYSDVDGLSHINAGYGNLVLRTSGTERVRINSSGNLGIGTVNPTSKLHIQDGSDGLRISATFLEQTSSSGLTLNGSNASGFIAFRVAGDERGRFTYGGYFKASNDGTYYDGTGAYHESKNTISNQPAHVFFTNNASYANNATFISCARAATSAYAFIMGYSGTNADIEFYIRGDGQAYADGSWNGGGADYAEMFEWADGNINNEDRVGYTVSLVGNKIKIAEEGDEVIGVISGNPSVVGDAAWNKWTEKYLKDEFNRYIFEDHNVVEWTDEDGKNHSYEDWNLPEDITVPSDATIKTHDEKGNRFTHRKLNPEYNPDQEYISREDRPEWDAVGLVGKLRVRKGQVIGSRWIKMQDISENVEEWLVR